MGKQFLWFSLGEPRAERNRCDGSHPSGAGGGWDLVLEQAGESTGAGFRLRHIHHHHGAPHPPLASTTTAAAAHWQWPGKWAASCQPKTFWGVKTSVQLRKHLKDPNFVHFDLLPQTDFQVKRRVLFNKLGKKESFSQPNKKAFEYKNLNGGSNQFFSKYVFPFLSRFSE